MGELVTRPVIGISATVEQARWGDWDDTVDLVPHVLVTAVQRAGGLAVVLDPERGGVDALALLDGLIIQAPEETLVLPNGSSPNLAALDAAGAPGHGRFLSQAAIEKRIPVLAVDRQSGRSAELDQTIAELVSSACDHRDRVSER